jgi:RNA polymerase sigma factor (sigma-70 family)
MVDDVELLRSYAENRSEAAFAELVRRHLNLVYSAALRRVGGDTHLAEDVSQKVFIALARQASSLRGRAVLTGWLYTAARFAAIQVVRTERRRRDREQEAEIMNELIPIPPPNPDWDKLRPVLDELMDRLNERDREALLLRFFEGRAFAELGRALDVTEEAARKRVDRALEKLRALLARRGIVSSAAVVTAMLAGQTVVAAPVGLAAALTGSALALSDVTVPAALTFFQLMSSSKIVGGAAAIVLIIAAGTATHEVLTLHAAEASLATENRDYDSLVTKRRELFDRVQSLEKATALLQKNIEEETAARAAAEARAITEVQAAKIAVAEDPTAAGYAFMIRHPEVKQVLDEYAAARANFKFRELYDALHFTPLQIHEFESLWGVGMGATGANEKPLSLRSGDNLSSEERTRRLRALLGPDGWQKFVECSKVVEARDITVKVAGALYFTDTPLKPGQADNVIQIFADNRTKPVERRDTNYDWDAVMNKAALSLSAPQLAVLERMRAQDRLNAALNAPTPAGSTPATTENRATRK